MAAVVAGFAAFGLATGAETAIAYPVMVVFGGLLVAAIEPEEGFGPLVLAGLCLWAVGHLAGGIVGIGEDRTLYNALLPGRIHFDNVVHFTGFGSSGLAWWEATRPWLPEAPGHRVGVWVAVWLAGMGVGAFNEVVEFAATHLLADTNVGGYQNTGRDLVANMLGAAVAASVAAARTGRAGARAEGPVSGSAVGAAARPAGSS
jgi:hypothetical protein